MCMSTEIKTVKMPNYNNVLANDLFGAVSFAQETYIPYSSLHSTIYNIVDKAGKIKNPIQAYVLDRYEFPFDEWKEILDLPLRLNTMHIDEFNKILRYPHEQFLEAFEKNTIPITMRGICGYGDKANSIIEEKIKEFSTFPRLFSDNTKAALYIYKKI